MSNNTENCTRGTVFRTEEEVLEFLEVSLTLLTIPAVLLAILLAHLQKRAHPKDGAEGCCKDKPGIPVPVNLIQLRKDRVLISVAIIVAGYITLEYVQKITMFSIESPTIFKGFFMLLNCLLFGLLCYPILVSVTSESKIGLILSSIYTWILSLTLLVAMLPCLNREFSGDSFGGYKANNSWAVPFELIEFTPKAALFLFLCIFVTHKTIAVLLRPAAAQTEPKIKMTAKVPRQDPGQATGTHATGTASPISSNLARRVANYPPMPEFRYSPVVVVGVSVGLIAIFTVTVKIGKDTVMGFDFMKYMLIDKGHLQTLCNTDLMLAYVEAEVSYKTVVAWINAAEIVAYVSIFSASMVAMSSVLMTLRQYRHHITNMSKGIYDGIPKLPVDEIPAGVVVAAAKYAGYQFAFSFFALVIQLVVFLIVGQMLVAIFMVVVYLGYWDGAYWAFQAVVPTMLFVFIIIFTQRSLVQRCFLEKNNDGKYLFVLRNKRAFLNYHYFMIFVSSAVGLVSSLKRILTACVFALWNLSRLDRSTMSRDYEKFDPGFYSFVAMLHLEHSLNHGQSNFLVDDNDSGVAMPAEDPRSPSVRRPEPTVLSHVA